MFNDVGVIAVNRPREDGTLEPGFRVFIAGGLGANPHPAQAIEEFTSRDMLLATIEACLRVFDHHGNRDNKLRARMKWLVDTMGMDELRERILKERRFLIASATYPGGVPEIVEALGDAPAGTGGEISGAPGVPVELKGVSGFEAWNLANVVRGRANGTVSAYAHARLGDVTSDQMDAIADLADAYTFGELRVSHEQNLIFADVRQADLFALWTELKALGLATPNVGLLTNIVCCPGGDFCSLANAKSIPIAEAIQRRFDDLDYLHDIGELDLNISGCMNSCGHHHIGHIGILGVDKNGAEWYQVSIGGSQGNDAALGKVIGPSFAAQQMPDVIAKLIETYLARRHDDERFVDTVHRLGVDPFKEHVYAAAH